MTIGRHHVRLLRRGRVALCRCGTTGTKHWLGTVDGRPVKIGLELAVVADAVRLELAR